jgi:sugar lactone lactonase YvrE/tetratricopeptide (TPR) repeat protein
MVSAFISYSRKNRPVAEYIAEALRARGAEVFIDYQKLIAGENFIGRLGEEIARRDAFILLLSPHSVESKWVQRETAWALHRDKPLIPVLLETCSLTNFFFLVGVEMVDFTRWSLDGEVEEALHKLARSLGLPTQAPPFPPPPPEAELSEDDLAALQLEPIPDFAPEMARRDLSDLFYTAVETADDDPEQAVFLYGRILEIDPDFMGGQARSFIEREERRLLPIRIQRMLDGAQAAMEAGEWGRAVSISRDILALQPDNLDAERMIAVCGRNVECEPLYKQALAAAEKGRWKAMARFLTVVKETCPAYGDPAGIFEMVDETLALTMSEAVLDYGLEAFVRPEMVIEGHSFNIMAVDISPDGALLATASGDKSARLWALASGEGRQTLEGHMAGVNAVTFAPDGRLLVTGAGDGTLRAWALEDEVTHLAGVLVGHYDAVNAAAFSENGRLLASGGGDGNVCLWDMGGRVPDETPLAVWGGHEGIVFGVAFSPQGDWLASASEDGTVRIWEVATGEILRVLRGHEKGVLGLAVSPDGRTLATASWDNTVRLWRMPGGGSIGVLRRHSNWVNGVAFSPDGRLLASAGADNTVRLWSVGDGRLVATLEEHRNVINTVRFGLEGRYLVSGSTGGTVRVWGVGM